MTDGIWMFTTEEDKEDLWSNFVVNDWYATLESLHEEFKIKSSTDGQCWEEQYLDRCYRLAPKELMVWSK